MTAVQTTPYKISDGSTVPAGTALFDGWGKRFLCNYAYPTHVYGTSERDNTASPSFFTSNPWYRPKKITGGYGLLALHNNAMSLASSRNMNLTNLIVATDGTAFLNTRDTSAYNDGGGILESWRWVHGNRNRMNVLLTDGHVDSISKPDVLVVWAPFAVFYAR